MIRHLSAADAKALLHAGSEIAFLDIREAGAFAEGHPFLASKCPYSVLEEDIGALVPRANLSVLLIDGGDGISDKAAASLVEMGYADVLIVEGGIEGWKSAGFGLFEGFNVLSRAMVDLAGAALGAQQINPVVLAAWRAAGLTFHLFDCRADCEITQGTVPFATCIPNGELAHRFPAAVTDGAPIVLTSTAQSRATAGALELTLSGVANQVFALEGGALGWVLSGGTLERDSRPATLPRLKAADQEVTRSRAAKLLEDHKIPVVRKSEVQSFTSQPARTTFLFDVRTAMEASGDRLPGFRHVSAGVLVSSVDDWVGVRHAQIILADDLGLRGALAAFWLRKMGYDVAVAMIDDDLRTITPVGKPEFRFEAPECSAHEALQAVWSGRGRLLDVRSLTQYRSSHVPGSFWSIRPRLAELPRDPLRPFYVVGDGSGRASLAALELLDLGHGIAHVIVGGFDALKRTGAPTEATAGIPTRSDADDDVRFSPGRFDGDLDAARLYLDWQKRLIDQLDPQERAEFAF